MFQLLLLCCSCAVNSYAQHWYGKVNVEVVKTRKTTSVSAKVVAYTESLGIDSSLVQQITRDIEKPMVIDRRLKKGTYTVVVKFIVSKDGTISDIQCENDPGYGLCQGVIRILKKSKIWTPAPQPVREFRTSKS